MSFAKNYAVAILLSTLCATIPAFAGDSPNEIHLRKASGNPLAGKDAAAMCQGCHGEDGNSAVPTFPKLAGQWATYIEKQFREFQNGARVDPTMTDMALSVNEFPELFDIAAYFASQKMMTAPLVENEAEEALHRKGEKLYNEGNPQSAAFRCVKCHGEHGTGEPLNNPLFPILYGQHKDYLVKQLRDFKSGARDNDRSGMMMLIAGRLTDDEIEALGGYLSTSLPPPAPPAPPPPVEEWRTQVEERSFTLEGTSFETGSAKLKKSAQKQLKPILDFAKDNPNANLEVVGHTDSTGSEELNKKLSLARAELVKQYLVKKGIQAHRIVTKGMGPAHPIADNDTKEGRAKNRRVEIHSSFKEEKKVLVNP